MKKNNLNGNLWTLFYLKKKELKWDYNVQRLLRKKYILWAVDRHSRTLKGLWFNGIAILASIELGILLI